jgi:biotin transport system substrate-specific component
MAHTTNQTATRPWTLPAIATDVLIVLGVTTLMAAAAFLRAWLPFTPVPVTFQTLVVLLGGALAGVRRGAASQGLYLGLGAVGAPIFAGGAAGLAIIAGPTGGYLAGFMFAAILVGRLLGGRRASLLKAVLVMSLGDAVILTCGATWLLALGFPPANAFMLGVVPFLLWDAVKVAVAATSYRLLVGRVQ